MFRRLCLIGVLAASAAAWAGGPPRRGRMAPEQLERMRQAMIDRIAQTNQREQTRRKSVHEKNHATILKAFRPVVTAPNASIAQVLCDGEAAMLGTVVDAGGLILTKASELRGTIECTMPGSKKKLKAKVVGVSDSHDLALLKVEAAGLTPVAWAEELPEVGSLVATPGGEADPVALGVISVAPRELKEPGFLGVGFQGDGDAPRVGEVVAKSAAEKAGIQPGDLITHIAGKPIETRQQLSSTIRKHAPGETLAIKLRRGDEEKSVTARLGSRRLSPERQSRLDLMNMYGGPLSDRRGGFAAALQHDTVLLPSQCGGPLVDLDGKAVGINVARAGRVESYAIAAAAVEPLLEALKSGKLAPKGGFDLVLRQRAVDRRIAAHESALRRAERDKADAERRIELARRTLDKDRAERARLEPKPEEPKKPEPLKAEKGKEEDDF